MSYFIDDSQQLEPILSKHVDKPRVLSKNEVFQNITNELLELDIIEMGQLHKMLKSNVRANGQLVAKIIFLLNQSELEIGDIQNVYTDYCNKWLFSPAKVKRVKRVT